MPKILRLKFVSLLIIAMSSNLFAIENKESISKGNSVDSPISHQYFCDEKPVYLNDLIVFNTAGFNNILWFGEGEQKGRAINPNKEVHDGDIYYAFQGLGRCFKGMEVHVHIGNNIAIPEAEIKQQFCVNTHPTLRDIRVKKNESFTQIFWFTDAQQETQALNPKTSLQDGATYYAFFGIGNCAEGIEIQVSLTEGGIAPPKGDAIFYCEHNCRLSDIKLQTDSGKVYWFDSDNNTGKTLKNHKILEKGKTYYAFQSLAKCAESLPIKVLDKETLILTDFDWSFKLHPNPVCSILHISFENTKYSKFVTISDANGKVFYKEFCDSELTNLEVNMNAFSSGMYWVKVISNGQNQIKKVIVK